MHMVSGIGLFDYTYDVGNAFNVVYFRFSGDSRRFGSDSCLYERAIRNHDVSLPDLQSGIGRKRVQRFVLCVGNRYNHDRSNVPDGYDFKTHSVQRGEGKVK